MANCLLGRLSLPLSLVACFSLGLGLSLGPSFCGRLLTLRFRLLSFDLLRIVDDGPKATAQHD